MATPDSPLGLFIQPACLQHKYIRHSNSSHIFERPERLRAVLLGVALAIARLEESEVDAPPSSAPIPSTSTSQDLSSLLSSLSIASTLTSHYIPSKHLNIIQPPRPPGNPGQILLHHPALQLAHSPPPNEGFSNAAGISSKYTRDLYKWASEAVERIKETGCEIPGGLGLNQGDLYLGPGSVLAIEGAVQTVCQAVDRVCESRVVKIEPTTPPAGLDASPSSSYFRREVAENDSPFTKAFCVIRPPGHHCGEDTPSGFCYVNNVVVGALHAYLEHDMDRAIIIDFDLHHGNGTQSLIMPLNAVSHAEDLAIKAGKPHNLVKGKRKRGWKGFYGSVHDIYSYPCEDGDLDLVKDASISLAGHGQYIENIHLQPYIDEADFYARIYPKYLALLDKAKVYMSETEADPSRTIVLISAGFDACEHEHQGMQRHDRRVPTSFFSQYTKDIVSFADMYTAGKVVSVLEGGYSDRALTSAALGHTLGMLSKNGEASWWSGANLDDVDKAIKRKRTGRLAPFPSEMSQHTYLQRAHALLSHFELTEHPPPPPPSTTATPQHSTNSRMTLRDRKKQEDVGVTPPVSTRKIAVRGGPDSGGLATTPSRRANSKPESSPFKQPIAAVMEGNKLEGRASGMADPSREDLLEDALALMSLGRDPSIESNPSIPLRDAASTSQTSIPVQPKIMLRIPRLNSNPSTVNAPRPAQLYPSLDFGSDRSQGESGAQSGESVESDGGYITAVSEISAEDAGKGVGVFLDRARQVDPRTSR